jgi:hypothetical protein
VQPVQLQEARLEFDYRPPDDRLDCRDCGVGEFVSPLGGLVGAEPERVRIGIFPRRALMSKVGADGVIPEHQLGQGNWVPAELEWLLEGQWDGTS